MKRAPSSGPRVNHARLNHQQIKEQEAIIKERQREDAAAAERKAALINRQKEQFAHVTSGLSKENLVGGGYKQQQRGGPVDDVEIKVFVRECDPDCQMFSMMESAALQAPPQFAAGRGLPSQPALARGGGGSGSGGGGGGGSSSAVPAMGRRAPSAGRAGGPPSREAPSSSSLATPASAHRGEVPQYLLRRKAEMQAEKDLIRAEVERQAELAKYPPGHRPVSEEERLDILAKLAERRKELEAELGRLPMRFDTQAIKNRKNQIEAEIAEVEAAERKFSVKKQLFVPI